MKEVTIPSPVKIGSDVYVIFCDAEIYDAKHKCPVCDGTGKITVYRYQTACGYCEGTGSIRPRIKHFAYMPGKVTEIEHTVDHKDGVADIPVYVRYETELDIVPEKKHLLNHEVNILPKRDVSRLCGSVVSTKNMAAYICELYNKEQVESLNRYNKVHHTSYKWPWSMPKRNPVYLSGQDQEYAEILDGANSLKYQLPCTLDEDVYVMGLWSHKISTCCPVCEGRKKLSIKRFKIPCTYCNASGTLEHVMVICNAYSTFVRRVSIKQSLSEGLTIESDNGGLLCDLMESIDRMPEANHERLAEQDHPQQYYFSSEEKRQAAMNTIRSVEHQALLEYIKKTGRSDYCKKVWKTLYGEELEFQES